MNLCRTPPPIIKICEWDPWFYMVPHGIPWETKCHTMAKITAEICGSMEPCHNLAMVRSNLM